MLHIESLQYIANRHKCTPICSFYFQRKFWNFLSLFKLSFLLVASHHTWYFSESVLLQLSLSEKRWITTMRERETNAGGQAHAILPCFCPISHERLISGQEQGEASEPFLYSRCWYAEWVQRGDMTCIPLPMAHPFLTIPSQGSWSWQDTWQGHCVCSWWSVCCCALQPKSPAATLNFGFIYTWTVAKLLKF